MLDLGLLPSAVQGEDGMDAMEGLLLAFLLMDGLGIHFNVFRGDTLRDAQAHPEKYPDLQIRVCGWNVLFRQMKKAEQDKFHCPGRSTGIKSSECFDKGPPVCYTERIL